MLERKLAKGLGPRSIWYKGVDSVEGVRVWLAGSQRVVRSELIIGYVLCGGRHGDRADGHKQSCVKVCCSLQSFLNG